MLQKERFEMMPVLCHTPMAKLIYQVSKKLIKKETINEQNSIMYSHKNCS